MACIHIRQHPCFLLIEQEFISPIIILQLHEMQFSTAILKQKYTAKNLSKHKDIVYFILLCA